MKGSMLFALVLSVLVAGCTEQKAQDKPTSKSRDLTDTGYNPKADIRVNKQYDDKGNLIWFDSTYSYHYESPGFKDDMIRSDSVFRNFKTPFRYNFDSMFDSSMSGIFFNDSLFKYDFYNPDYFSKRFQLNMKRFEDMFYRMDSLKSGWLHRTYPHGNLKKDSDIK
jgi:hypothetical protein